MAGYDALPPVMHELKDSDEQLAPVYIAIPTSVSVPGEATIVNAPPAGTTAENHTSPSLLPPSQATSGTEELVADTFVPPAGVQDEPTVSAVAEQGSSFAGCANDTWLMNWNMMRANAESLLFFYRLSVLQIYHSCN